MHPKEVEARLLIRAQPLSSILASWNRAINREGEEQILVRGWLLDELEARNKTAFDAWMQSETYQPDPAPFFR